MTWDNWHENLKWIARECVILCVRLRNTQDELCSVKLDQYTIALGTSAVLAGSLTKARGCGNREHVGIGIWIAENARRSIPYYWDCLFPRLGVHQVPSTRPPHSARLLQQVKWAKYQWRSTLYGVDTL